MTPDRLGRLKRALVLLGLALCCIGVSAPYLGLGRGTEYLFYRLLHANTSYVGMIVALIGLLPATMLSYKRALRAEVGAALTAETQSMRARGSAAVPMVLMWQVLLVAAVGAIAFWRASASLLGYIDGQYLLTLVRNQGEFAPLGPVFSSNPLQGLDDLWFFTNTRWIPELAVARLFSDVGLQRSAVHCVAATEIFAVVAFVSYWLGSSAGKAAAAGWLAVIMIEPLAYPSLIVNISPDGPELATLIAVPLLIVPLWAGIGTGSPWTDLLRAAAISCLMWLHFIAVALFAALSYPFLAMTGLVFLLAAWPDRREFRRKAAWGAGLVAALVVTGLPQALLGMTTDTAFYFFPHTLMRPVRLLSDTTILLRPSEPVGAVIALLGLIGATIHAVFGKGRLRCFAVAVLILVALLLGAAVIYALIGFNGSIPIYYEYVLWAVYPIFAVSPVAAAFRYLSRHLPADQVAAWLGTWRWVACPLAAVLVIHGANAMRGIEISRPNVFPPKPSDITEYLRNAIGLYRGAPFRGRVVTMTGQNLHAGLTWEEMFMRDMQIIRAIGNEHRDVGLWYYGVPTLFEFTHTISPLLYTVASRYLAPPDDPQFRTLLHMRRREIGVLRLLGVRYVITDGAQPAAGTRRVRVLPVPADNSALALDEIPDPNLGVSPTEILPLGPGGEALAWLDQPALDFSRQALLAGPATAPLVEASDIQIEIERGGIRVHAASAGHSVVVIPFQFSHCLRAIAQVGTAPPELRRADLLLTGILFEKQLDATIEYRSPIFGGAYCWLDDRADDRDLLRQ